MKPNFLIIGAPRCGTTTLYEGLLQHPDVFMSPRKEPWFSGFTGDPGPWQGPGDAQPMTGWDAYEGLFAGARSQRAIGEASTLYLWAPAAAERIRAQLPEAKLIAILRNPVDRAYSNFLEHVQEGRERELDFGRAAASEELRLRRRWAPSWGYVELGFYGRQLERYYAQFPQSQILPLLYDDLRDDPGAVFTRIFSFLGVDATFQPVLPPRINENSGIPKSRLVHAVLTRPNPLRSALRGVLTEAARKSLRSWLLHRTLQRPTLDPALRLQLTERYREDIGRAAELLQRDLGHWLPAKA